MTPVRHQERVLPTQLIPMTLGTVLAGGFCKTPKAGPFQCLNSTLLGNQKKKASSFHLEAAASHLCLPVPAA